MRSADALHPVQEAGLGRGQTLASRVLAGGWLLVCLVVRRTVLPFVLAQQASARQVQLESARQDVELKLGGSHRLPITVYLQGKRASD